MVYNRATISGGFIGCATNLNSTLDTCCAAVGSTPAFVNGSYGCPFNYTGSLKETWNQCIEKDPNGSGTICSDPSIASWDTRSIEAPSKLLIFVTAMVFIGSIAVTSI